MAKQFQFADFVDEFKVDFTAFITSPGVYNSEGKWIAGSEVSTPMAGIILPIGDDDSIFSTNGVHTEKARKLYTTVKLSMGTRIEYNGSSYLIKQEKDYEAYADVYIYLAEGAE